MIGSVALAAACLSVSTPLTASAMSALPSCTIVSGRTSSPVASPAASPLLSRQMLLPLWDLRWCHTQGTDEPPSLSHERTSPFPSPSCLVASRPQAESSIVTCLHPAPTRSHQLPLLCHSLPLSATRCHSSTQVAPGQGQVYQQGKPPKTLSVRTTAIHLQVHSCLL